ncbi:TPM domain-containing protein [Mycobacterium sp. Aquia_216]|uniref:TPM domain-containing protein n=1 Tax=Mycobacterium sp. Aquia_216 TaxID=2991729 RepID=UPI00227C88D5|nr:TPM domain-containing protein [Mycobacterium sp. Aquia_216]WAJ43521.1 TPM domain-containing protein [Mycobacterium sp. Aquia_216]
MRIVRLFGVVLTFLTAGLLMAAPAGAAPPSKLTDHLTDSSGVLTNSDRATVSSAIDRLYHDRHIQLWVVYVDNFNRFKPENWANKTRSESGMGDNDVLLAVGTNTKAYAFVVPPKVDVLTTAELNSLQANKIEPAIGAKNWSGAAVAAADGLDKTDGSTKPATSSKRSWLPIAIGVVVVVVVVVVVLLFLRARRRRRAAQPVGPSGGQADIGGRVDSLASALATADARVRQISDYVTRHRQSIGAETKTRLEETKRSLASAHSKEARNAAEAIADANRASTLAAQAQTLANADVRAAHRTPRRQGTA